jgi:hypothetical protein
MWSEVKVEEDVALRLAHLAERQLSGTDIVEHYHSAEDLPIARAYRRNSGSHRG